MRDRAVRADGAIPHERAAPTDVPATTRLRPTWVVAVSAMTFALCVAKARTADAAAWPRKEGQGFLSFNLRRTVDGPDFGDFGSLYYEYGLTERLTFGVDIGSNIATGQTKAIAFLRHPVMQSDGPDVFAVEMGVGLTDRQAGKIFTLQPGLSWGRPVEGGWGRGWLGIEGKLALFEDSGSLRKIEATFGINHDSGSLSIFQLIQSDPSGGPSSWAVEASHVVKLSERTFLDLGASYGFSQAPVVVKIGFWQIF